MTWFQPRGKYQIELLPPNKTLQKHTKHLTQKNNPNNPDLNISNSYLPQQGTAFVLQRNKTYFKLYKCRQYELLKFGEQRWSDQLTIQVKANIDKLIHSRGYVDEALRFSGCQLETF